MSTNTTNSPAPEAMRTCIDQRVRTDPCNNIIEHLRNLIEQGLNSGAGQPLTPGRLAELRKRALGDQR